jgi:biotin operon repressor
MMTRREQILDTLEFGPASTAALAGILNAPEASVRRNIQELRAEGHYIEYGGGRARLVSSAPAAKGVSGGSGW